MSGAGRKLSPDEAELWAKVAKTVVPIRDPFDEGIAVAGGQALPSASKDGSAGGGHAAGIARASAPSTMPSRPKSVNDVQLHGLDSGWDRKLARGLAEPDFTLDLHGCTLDTAHSRLMHGLAQAKAMRARVVLLIAGKPRPVEAGERGQRRGAIRAKVIDWLSSSEHALDIAAIRGAHRRHGGPGALYIVLKRRR